MNFSPSNPAVRISRAKRLLLHQLQKILIGRESRSRPLLFNIDLHISIIRDLSSIFEPLGVDIFDWSMSGHANLLGRSPEPVRHLRSGGWLDLSDERISAFKKTYGHFLSRFDGFVCCYPPAFVELYADFGKPIIAVSATRYEYPFTPNKQRWQRFNQVLQDLTAIDQLSLVANNEGDRDYMKYHLQIGPTLIPTLGGYCEAQRSSSNGNTLIYCRENNYFDTVRNAVPSSRIGTVNQLYGKGASWRTLHQSSASIHIPYNISQMTIFEQYWAALPILIPDDQLLMDLARRFPKSILSELSFFQILNLETSSLPENSPNNYLSDDFYRWWLERADFRRGGELREIRRFRDLEELRHFLAPDLLEEQSENMRVHNRERETLIQQSWAKILEKHSLLQCTN